MNISHPYATAQKSAFWSRSVARDWSPCEVVRSQGFLIRHNDKVVSAGSCFASNIIPYLEQAGLTYLRTETTHAAFAELPPERLGYANFSAAYGNIYTARQLLQLLKRCLGTFSPAEDRWVIGDEVVDPLRPGLRYRATCNREFDLLTAQHLRCTREAFETADVFVFTLGLTEAWASRLDGTVFPACPGTVAGSFEPERHEFKNFNVAEVVADLGEFIQLLRQLNPQPRIILTVSPVPLVATATGCHVLTSTIYSKSVLRAAAGEIASSHPDVTYFPAYEIVTGPQAPSDFFGADRRSVSRSGIETVMQALLAHCEVAAGSTDTAPHIALSAEQPAASHAVNGSISSRMSRLIAEAECEEAMADASLAFPSPTPSTSVQASPSKPQVKAPAASDELAALRLRLDELQQASSGHRAASDAKLDEVREQLAAARAAFEAELGRANIERDAAIAASAKWFEAAIAITADHNPLIANRSHQRRRWLSRLAQRFGRRRVSPVALGDRAFAAGRWQLAARYYRDALDLRPTDPRVWFQCAYALQAAGKPFEAEAAFRKAFEHSGSWQQPPLPAAGHDH